MLKKPSNTPESILGYTLTERIGAGGYGEVWAAEAPGGLRKAVKLIFGFHDENRAQRELKSLNRVKEVRHPFLLSLERIDVVDGRLVVVTELAEKSLNDRFNEAIRAGDTGIPRDELLVYVSDAADALDYLSDSHGLQHLDIKPENLLLVGGHVKVADFGLVKELGDGTQSLMSGLTPSYAPPELFDGRPSQNSDQYSLAIVFQEMLTGCRPFAGQTAAQLATQHLHGTPDLSELPPADRGVVKRALAKSPDARYTNCRSFVEELRRLKRNRPTRDGRRKRPVRNSAAVGTLTLSSSQMERVKQRLEETKLPPVRPGSATFHPTIFVGIGETATNLVANLRTSIRQRLGLSSQTPGLGFICLDTDTKNLDQNTCGASDVGLEFGEILPIPLRSSAEYRDRKGLKLNWLSRRWIYNVPRSLQTESLRPLGRLAFVDHASTIFKRFEKIVGEATDEASTLEMAGTLGLAAEAQHAEVYIVASISGGIGSGCVADVAYAMRTVLAEAGVDATVNGILLSSIGRSSTRRDVSVANTFCCLSELNHFNENGFPGDDASQLPAFEEDAPFDETYLVDLGTDPLPDEYEATMNEVEEYLFLNTLTPCGSYFDACRVTDAEASDGFTMRTVGVAKSPGEDLMKLSANLLSRELFKVWLNGDDQDGEHDAFDHRRYVAEKLPEIGLGKDKVVQHIQQQLVNCMGRPVETIIASDLQPIIDECVSYVKSGATSELLRMIQTTVDTVLGLETVSREAQFEASVRNVVERTVDERAALLGDELVETIMSCLNFHGGRIVHAELTCQVFSERLSQVIHSIDEKVSHLRGQVSEVEKSLVAGYPDTKPSDDTIHREYCERTHAYGAVRLAEFILSHARRLVAAVQIRSEKLADPLRDMRTAIAALEDDCKSQYAGIERITSLGDTDATAVVRTALLKFVKNQLPRMRMSLDQRLQRTFFSSFNGMHRLVEEFRGNWRDKVQAAICRESKIVIAEFICASDFDKVLTQAGVTDEQLHRWATSMSALGVPHLLSRNGGGSRLVIATPMGKRSERITNVFHQHADLLDQPSVIAATRGDVLFCYEVGMMPASLVAAQILHSCPEAGELVPRIHSRTDVEWSNLIQF